MSGPDDSDDARAFLFFSVDIVDSVAYKTRYLNAWPADLHPFFQAFPAALAAECERALLPAGREHRLPSPSTWKHSGDEILFFVDIADAFGHAEPRDDIQPYELALYYANAVTRTIKRHNSDSYRRLAANEPAFLLKGTAWFAPVTATDSYSDSIGNVVLAMSDWRHTHAPGQDFVGRQIDIGFRIARFASANRFVLSGEYAILLLRDNSVTVRRAALDVCHDGRKPIKGILPDLGYPLLYIDMGDAFERAERQLDGTSIQPPDAASTMNYLQEYIKRTTGLLQYPFIKHDKLFG